MLQVKIGRNVVNFGLIIVESLCLLFTLSNVNVLLMAHNITFNLKLYH